MLLRPASLLLLPALFLLLVGCGKTGPKTYTVSGNVTINNAPLDKGQIAFSPKDGKTPGSGGPITNGKYSVPLQAGDYKAEVTATRTAGNVDPAMGAAPQKQYIADKFNINTTLEAKVTPEGPNTYDYTVSE
jgi:hypothetical protein